MEMEQHHQEQHKHTCKLCDKSFSSGKVLGGHMRSHPFKNSSKRERNHKNASSLKDSEQHIGQTSSSSSSYDLRKNLKKIQKFSPPNAIVSGQESNLCKVCGKGFSSTRALFGHMRHHSAKHKQEVIQYKESNNETALRPVKRKRSSRSRYNKETSDPSSPSCSASELNEFPSFIAEIEPEVHELALCLLMLSRGVRNCELAADSKMPQLDDDIELGQEFMEETVLGMESGLRPKKFRPRRKPRIQSHDDVNDVSDVNASKETFRTNSEYKCKICNKIFGSYQALGGHSAMHKRSQKLMGRKISEVDENSYEHNCSVSFKVFGSGQALGGYKKALVVKKSESIEELSRSYDGGRI